MLARLSMARVIFVPSCVHNVYTSQYFVHTPERLNSNKNIREKEGASRKVSRGRVRNPLNKSRGGEDGKCADKTCRGWGGEVIPPPPLPPSLFTTIFTTTHHHHYLPPPATTFTIIYHCHHFIILYYYLFLSFFHHSLLPPITIIPPQQNFTTTVISQQSQPHYLHMSSL